MAIWRVMNVLWFMPSAYERPWHEIYSTYQFMGYKLIEHDMIQKHLNTSVIHEMYIVHRSFKLVGWYRLTTLIL